MPELSTAPTPAPLDGTRVAVLNWRDPWHGQAGGAEQYAYEISLGLLRAGARVDFSTARDKGQSRREDRDGITWLRAGGRWTVYPAVLLRLLTRRLTGRGYDLVLDCQNGIPFFSPWAVSRRTPVLLIMHHVHDAQFGVHFPGPVAAFGRWLEGPVSRLAYRRATAVAVSPSTIAAMRGRLRWRGRIELVHNGVRGPDQAAGPVGAGLEERSPTPRVAAVGRLVRHKRVDQIVALADELAGTWSDLDIHIVGGGPDEQTVRAAADRIAHTERATVHGFTGAREKDSLLRSAWLHVSASHGEGWGLCVVEAAACGIPTVAYDVDGLRDAVRDGRTGWLVAEGESLADTVSRALKELSDPARAAEIRHECLAWAAEFSWERSGRLMAELARAELDRRGAA